MNYIKGDTNRIKISFFAEWNELIDDERGKAGELYIVERTEKRD